MLNTRDRKINPVHTATYLMSPFCGKNRYPWRGPNMLSWFQSSIDLSKAKKMFSFQSESQRRLKNSFHERFIIGYHIALPVSKIRLKSIQNRFQYFIFPECQPDWIILGFETCDLSCSRKWSKAIAGATSAASCRNEDIWVRPFRCKLSQVLVWFFTRIHHITFLSIFDICLDSTPPIGTDIFEVWVVIEFYFK